jgi:antitoxin CptB
MSEADEIELRRLRWRCRRGMRELDQLLVRYLDRAWRQSSNEDRAVFLTLLDTEDDKLWRWFMGHDSPTDAALDTLVQRIRSLPA